MKGHLPEGWQKRLSDDDEWSGVPVVVPGAEPEVAEKPPLETAEGFIPLFEEPGASAEALDWARHYLLAPKSVKVGNGKPCRNLALQTAVEMGVGAALHGKLAGRVIFPIPNYADPSQPWRGWVARDATGTSALPYRYPKGMNRIGLVYNEPALYVETAAPCFIGEGVLDAAPLWPDAVACLGKPLESQIELFLRARRPLVVVLDGDAHLEAAALAMKLHFLGKRAGSIRLPPRTDPDEVPRAWLEEQAREALRGALRWDVQ
jgi:hypothetical protein